MDLLEIINEHYDSCTGAIVTGSHLKPGFDNLRSDVDIIVFDAIFSVVTTTVIYQQNHKIDITQVPINDIDNVLRNEQFDQRGILLTMIATGKILKDTEDYLIEKLKGRAAELFSTGIHDNLPTYKALMKGLVKIRKEFDRELDQYSKMFLINEFFSTITQMELIRVSKWRFSGKHKANLLYESSREFVEQVHDLVKSASNSSDIQLFRKIGTFIDEYLMVRSLSKEKRLFEYNYLWIDIDYKDINIRHFVKAVLPAINDVPFMKERYHHFFLSPTAQHRIYRNKLSLCFDKCGSEDREIIERLGLIFSNGLKLPYGFSVIPNYALNEVTSRNRFNAAFRQCEAEASMLAQQLVSNYDTYDAKRNLIMGLIVNSFLLSSLEIEASDALQLLYYLSSRYITNKREQDGKNAQALNKHRTIRYGDYFKYFKENSELFNNAFVKGRSLAENRDFDDTKLYTPLLKKLSAFLEANLNNKELLNNSYILTLTAIKPAIKNTPLTNCLLMIMIFEQLQPALLLDTQITALELTILSQCLGELQPGTVSGN